MQWIFPLHRHIGRHRNTACISRSGYGALLAVAVSFTRTGDPSDFSAKGSRDAISKDCLEKALLTLQTNCYNYPMTVIRTYLKYLYMVIFLYTTTYELQCKRRFFERVQSTKGKTCEWVSRRRGRTCEWVSRSRKRTLEWVRTRRGRRTLGFWRLVTDTGLYRGKRRTREWVRRRRRKRRKKRRRNSRRRK